MNPGKCSATLLLFCAVGLRADVSFTTTFNIELGPGMQPVAQAIGDSLHNAMPAYRVRIKGSRYASQVNDLNIISEPDGEKITLIDLQTKSYATGTLADLLGEMKGAATFPPQLQQMMSSVQISSRKTGRTDVVEGVTVGEREITLSMKIPIPESAGGPSPEMKMLMHIWSPLPGEIERVPALREIQTATAGAAGNPLLGQNMLQTFTSMFPMGDLVKKLSDEMSQDRSYPLRSEFEITMPGLAEMIGRTNPAGTSSPVPSGPLFVMTMQVKELSTTPIDDSVFQIPGGYQPVPFPDLAKKRMK
jgi:hypothetical protein